VQVEVELIDREELSDEPRRPTIGAREERYWRSRNDDYQGEDVEEVKRRSRTELELGALLLR
jgi:hypothetical protein